MIRRRLAALVGCAAVLCGVASCTDPSPQPSEESGYTQHPCEIEAAGVDFLAAEAAFERQRADGQGGGALFESMTSATCDGFDRVIVEFDGPAEHPLHLGVWARWTEGFRFDSGVPAEIDGEALLQIDVVGATWQPNTGGSHSVSVPPGGWIAEVQYHDVSGGSGVLLIGADEPTEYRVILDRPDRLIVDTRHR